MNICVCQSADVNITNTNKHTDFLKTKTLNVTDLTVNAKKDIHGTVQLHRMSLFDLWVHQMSPRQPFPESDN